MKLFQRLKLFFLLNATLKDADWTEADRKGLEAWLNSHSGKNFMTKMRYFIVKQNSSALRGSDLNWKAGHACGFEDAFKWIEIISSASVKNDEESEENLDSQEGRGVAEAFEDLISP